LTSLGTDLSNANLAGANLEQALLFDTNLEGADLSQANLKEAVIVNFMGGSMEGANFIGADLTGVFGFADLSTATLGNATCPDGTSAEDTSCASGLSQVPPPLAAPLFLADTTVQIVITPFTTPMDYIGVHQFIPGVSAATMSSSLIIGESSWLALVGPDEVANYSSTTWIVEVDGVGGEALEALASKLSADFRVSSVLDWSSSHKEVERNGGLIFGTPGLLSFNSLCQHCSSCFQFRFPFVGVKSASEGTGSSASNRCITKPNHSVGVVRDPFYCHGFHGSWNCSWNRCRSVVQRIL